MTAKALMKKLAWTFAAVAVLLMVVVLDWLPTVKDLSRLRREQRDDILKIKNSAVETSGFIFPDAEEKSLFAENDALLYRSLPQLYDNDAWLALVMLEMGARFRSENIANGRILFSEHGWGTEFDPQGPKESDPLVDWLRLQYWDIRKSFQFADEPGRYPWHGVFSDSEFIGKQRLASRTLAVALAAPLPALLDFINRTAWGETRLEIVCLHLEPGADLSRAWLICRGTYLVRRPSARFAVKEVSGIVGGDLLVDPDSPLLWQKVNRGIVFEVSPR